MLVSLIAGIGRNREIGLNNQLLWHLKDDLRNFKKITMGHHLLMGRKTFASIGKALPGRTSIILSQKAGLAEESCFYAHSLVEAFDLAKSRHEQELFVIGGGEIYAQTLPFAHRLYLSRVEFEGPADTFFPEFEHYPWKELCRVDMPRVEGVAPPWSFHILEKVPLAWLSN